MHELRIRRLNMDNSWQIQWGDESILLDPWLSGPEIDGFKAFNIQWHATEPLPYEALGNISLILVSQPYSDHCHEETLKKLQGNFDIWGVKPALKRIQKWVTDITLGEIPDISEGFAKKGNLEIAKMSPNRLIDPIYHALIIKKGDCYIFYAPHGFSPTETQLNALKSYSCLLLITTLTRFMLPVILGGVINPGVEQAADLINKLQPTHLVNTHDEEKIAKGIVMKLAKVHYAGKKEWEMLETLTKTHQLKNYQEIEL